MPTTNLYQRIPALIHGISRQSPTIRFPGQVNDALNVNLDVVDGARKRSGTEHVAFIAGAIEYNGKYKCHRIRRDNEEQYLVVIGPTGFIRVVDVLTGSVVTPTVTTNAANYLSYAGASANDIRMVTIADTTFIVNTKVPTETTDSTNTQLSANRMPIKMQRTSTSPLAFSIDTVTWKQRPFYRQIIKKNGAAPTGGTFKLTYLGVETPLAIPFNAKASGTQLATLVNIEGALVGDGTTNYQGIRTLTRGKIIVSGGPLPERDVVVDFSPDLEVSSLMTVTGSTLSGGGSYTVVRGDDETQPAPQFVIDKRPISDIGYFRNRLILVADDYIQFSAADDLFMMFKERADVIVDSDPFTLQLSANDVTIIDNIVPFRKSVLVLTESGQQFEVTSGDVFGPGQVAVTASTKYQTKPVRPVAIGERIYMLGQHPTRSILYEYYYSDNAVSNLASDVSKHVDGLIPTSAIALDASENSDMVVVVAAPEADYPPEAFSTNQTGAWDDGDSWNGGESPQPWDEVTITNTITFLQYPAVTKKSGLPATEIFVYKSYTVGQERKQSAWARWSFGNDNIQSLAVFDDELYIIRRDDDQTAGASGLFIEKMAMTDQKTAQDGWPYQVQIDHQRTFAAGTGTYNAGNNTTSWVLGYNADIDVCVLTNMSTVPIASNTNGTVTVSGNYIGESVMFGRRYSAELELSKVLFRPDDKPVTEGKTTITKMVVDHVNSGSYEVETTRLPANTTTSKFVPSGGSSEYGKYTAWITTDADRCEIKLKSDSVYPVTWSGLEYHGTFATLREFKQ